MTKQQLTRLLIVLLIAAAIIFVPYWACYLTTPFSDFRSQWGNILMNWLLGVIYTCVIFLACSFLIKIIIPTIINYIKTGKP